MKRVAVLGSTGSIGVQTLEVIEGGGWGYYAPLLACGRNIGLLMEQIKRFRPEAVAVLRREDAEAIRRERPDIDVYCGESGLLQAIEETEFDMAVNALVGISGMAPTMKLIEKGGVRIALANKETLVAGGRIVMSAAKEAGVSILPVDSEHSAVLQAFRGNEKNRIKRIILTASGGPFRGYTRERLEGVSVKEALAHPNWAMGKKISVDSATMMNKALEIIEAKWLYSLAPQKIDVLVHPQSIVHSMVEYDDGAMMAQLGTPDMRLPIAYALTYPERHSSGARRLSVKDLCRLDFEEPSAEACRALNLAYAVLQEIADTSKDSPAIALNGANEALVALFLEGRIRFVDIVDTLEKLIAIHEPARAMSIGDILEIDAKARKDAERLAGIKTLL
ncbi:MAG: 1-deoxy-D-xylulose-5-phosphate reductoisomerase [Clostridiales Family XIII bacterium]|jgi:1-deoxy-D-xylulose-5-phosphate reductoisomerase|nr:1-deoxy-D-xylulose-5-phosphate reductoisomerase [Clostridiales Family XIII bacterium]